MQTEVLRFIHPDYEVIVRTQDISIRGNASRVASIIQGETIQILMRQKHIVNIPQKMNVNFAYTVQLQGRKLKTKKKQNLQRARFGISYGLSSLKLVNIKFAYYSMV